ncbi:hypothetical protein CYLTODRAFT_410305 [Cylindrobasidium torrendii FP15055 ss-10]|uniref:Uncharacterized protein n=1 Tax=Cylindrobasidium torrendii FP15055 ss-10 TaxID=1314674 RepID=A0A0D7BEF2_9AGAR|nr:hypothetical protein CYLTODRAFT_410305 [Cylindrobasidium torrendii FP15055 ss-10]
MRRHWNSTHPDIVRFCLFPECTYHVAYGTSSAVKRHAMRRHGEFHGEAICVVHPMYAKRAKPKDRSEYLNKSPFYRFVVPEWNEDAEGEIDEEYAGDLQPKLFIGCGLVHRLYPTPYAQRGLPIKEDTFEPDDPSEYDPEERDSEDELEEDRPPSPTWTEQMEQLFPMDDSEPQNAPAEQSTPTWNMLLQLPDVPMDVTAMPPRPASQYPPVAGPSNLSHSTNTSFYLGNGIAPFNYLSQMPATAFPSYGQDNSAYSVNTWSWFDGMEY